MFGVLALCRYLTPDEDWYFTSSTRLNGEDLLQQGQQLLGDRTTLEAEE